MVADDGLGTTSAYFWKPIIHSLLASEAGLFPTRSWDTVAFTVGTFDHKNRGKELAGGYYLVVMMLKSDFVEAPWWSEGGGSEEAAWWSEGGAGEDAAVGNEGGAGVEAAWRSEGGAGAEAAWWSEGGAGVEAAVGSEGGAGELAAVGSEGGDGERAVGGDGEMGSGQRRRLRRIHAKGQAFVNAETRARNERRLEWWAEQHAELYF